MALLGDSKIVSLTLLDGVIGDLNPKTTNVYDLGTTSLKWKNIYGMNIHGNGSNLTNLNASNLSSGTLPDARLSTITRSNTTSTSSISLPNSFEAIDSISTDNYGRVTAVDTKTITLADRIFPVTVTLTSLSTGTSDKTNTEIETAVSEGKIPFVSIIYGAAKMLAPLTFINSSEAVFTYENQADSDFTYATLVITNGNEASLAWQSKYFAQGSTYWGNELATTSAKYNTNPEVASVIIGNGGNSNPSSKNVQLQYDENLEVLNFVFA